MELKAGQRLASVVCTTEVVVVRAPEGDVSLECGGHPMAEAGQVPPDRPTLDPAHDGGTLVGKRYEAADAHLELLCVKAGDGSLSSAGTALGLKAPKPLPASD